MKFPVVAAIFSAAAHSSAESSHSSTTDSASVFCCNALEAAGFGDRVQYPSHISYQQRIESYFSVRAQLQPWCLVQPVTTAEVSKIVSTLVEANKEQQCHFAIRSGGHTTWDGAAGIEDGVTIDLGLMNSTTYYPGNSTAGAQPGARWGDVYKELDEVGVATAGGRVASVGVGGLVLGGGYSFFSARKGMVCDSVANFEVVLASGEIVNANKDVNADLWQALKGGSNNFGIVTRIDLKTFDNPGIWAGMVAYPHSTAPLHAKALVHFTDKLEEDPYATMIHCIQYSPALGQTIIANAYVYSKPIARAPIYDEFLAIPGNFSDDTKVTTMSAFTAGAVEHPESYRVIFVTATFQNDERVMQKAIELQDLMVEELKKVSEDWWSLSVFQPLPTLYAKHSAANGGNVLGLDRFDENAILFLVDLGWKGAEFDGAFEGAAQKLTDDIDEFAKSIGKGNEWIYLDYAYKTQKPLESYGAANVEKIRKVAAKYDPDGVFQKLVPGGFKVSKVPTSPFEKSNRGRDEL